VQRFQNATGFSSVATYLESLRAFIEDGNRKGVIVFALSNNASATSAVMPAGLPAALKKSSDTAEQALGDKLRAGWIVAVNAVPNFDSNGRIISAVRLSSKCLEMADSCLTGDGYTKGASATGDSAYSYGTGTSFVAPQISAGIALLAQAFPSLPATDLRKRLLASANNSFYSNYVGTSDFGNGVTHKYNEEFGHGFLDMKAALMPIGAVGLPNTASAYGGVQPLSSSQIVTASAQGQAVSKSLGASNLTIFDSLGADFRVSAGALSGGTRSDVDLARRFRRFTASAYNGTTAFGMPAFSSGGALGGTDGWSFAFGRSDDVVASFGAAPSLADIGPSARTMQGLLPDSLSFGASTTTSPGSRTAFYAFGSLDEQQRSFVSGLPVEAPDRRKSFGAGIVQSMKMDTTTVSFGASVMGEPQSALGMTSSGALGATRGLSAAFDFGISQPIMEKTRVFATAQLGASLADANGLMRTDGRTAFSGFGLGVERTGVFRERDAVSFAVSQPLRAETGRASVIVPNGRSVDGVVQWKQVGFDMTPEARQLDWTVAYATQFDGDRSLRFATTLSTAAGHVAGATQAAAMASFAQRF
jgi:hypothetical protein